MTLKELRKIEPSKLLESLCHAEQTGIKKDIQLIKKVINEKKNTIHVSYECGYQWSVKVVREDESRQTRLTKFEAMQLAKEIKKNEFNNMAWINEDILSKKEISENMKYLKSEK